MESTLERPAFALRARRISRRSKRAYAAVFACALLATTAGAATKTWDNGGSDNLWGTAANWNPDGVPGSADDVVFNSGSANCYYDKISETIASLTFTSGYTGKFQWGYAQFGKGLRGQYYSNNAYTGGTYSRVDATVNFASDWGEPASGIGTDDTRVIWTGYILPQYAETYTFYETSDDGGKLWVNGNLIIDVWAGSGMVTNQATMGSAFAAATLYPIKYEYYEGTGSSGAILEWSSASRTREVIPQNRMFPDHNGLKSQWWSNTDLTGTTGTNATPFVDYDWGAVGPDDFFTNDDFSGQIEGFIIPQYTETYTFHSYKDDGMKLWVNDVSILDSWNCGCGNVSSSTIDLVAGVPYYITMQFRDTGGNGYMNLQWSSASQSQQVVPHDRLYVPYWLNVSGTVDLRSGGEINMDAGELQFIGSGSQTFHPKSGTTLARVIQNGTGTTTITTNNLTAKYLEVRQGTLNLGTGRTVTPSYFKILGGTVNFNTSTLNLAQKEISFASVGSATSGAAGSSLVVTTSTAYTTTLSGTLTGADLDVTFNGNGAATVSGNLSTGAGTLTKNGTNTLTLTGNNGGMTSSGAITVSAGTLQMNHASGVIYDVGTITNNATLNMNPTAGAVIDIRSRWRGSGTWNIDGPGGGTYLQNRVLNRGNATASDNTGPINIINSGRLWQESTSGASFNGPTSVITIDAGGLLAPVGSGTRVIGGLSGSGTVNVNYPMANPTLEISNASDYTFSGIIKNDQNTLSLVKSGAGELTLSGANTFSGGYTHTAGDTKIGHNTALGSGTAVMNGTGRFLPLDGINVGNALTINANNPGSGLGTIQGPANPGTATWSGNITINNQQGAGGHLQGGNATGGLIITGSITSSVALVVRANRVTLSGGGSYAELWVGGTCVQGASGGIVSGTALTIGVSATGTVDMNGYNLTVSDLLKGAQTATLTNSGAAATLNVAFAGSGGTYAGAITGAVNFLKTGAGDFTMNGSGSYTGTTTVSAGSFIIGSSGNVSATQSFIVTSGASATVDGTLAMASDATGVFGIGYGVASGTSTFTMNTGSSVTIGTGGGRTFVGGGPNGGPYGTGVLTIAGGTLTVAAAGAFPNDDLYVAGYGGTGTINLNGGTLISSRQVQEGNGSSSMYFNGGTFRAGIGGWFFPGFDTFQVRNGGAIFDPNGLDVGVDDDLIHSAQGGDNATDGGLTVTGSSAGRLFLRRTGAAWTGPTTVNAGVTLLLDADGVIPNASPVTVNGTLDMSTQNETIGSLAGSGTVDNSNGAGTYTLTTGGNNTSTDYTGLVKNTSGSLAIVKAGTGQLLFTGNNTYTGGTTINGGRLAVSHNNGFGTQTVTVNAGGSAMIWAPSAVTIANNFVLNGSSGDAMYPTLNHDGGGGLVTINGNISVTAASEIGMGGATWNNMILNGVISGSGALTIDEANSSDRNTLILAGANTFTGSLLVTPGTLRLGAANVIPDGVAVTVNNTNAVLDLYGQSETIGSLAGNANGVVDNTSGVGTYTLTHGGDNTSTSWAGVIKNTSGTVAITKAGTGTWTNSGANTYTGATTVNGGILKLGHVSAALGTSAGGLTVATGAALDLNGQTYATSETSTTITGTGVSSGGAIMNSSSTGATYPGLLTLGGAASIIAGTGTIAISNAGTITGAGHYLTLGGAQNGTLTSIVGTGSGKIYKQDAGTWTLNGASTYTGGSEISGGTLSINAENRLGAPSGATLLTFAGNSTLAVTTGFTTTKEFYSNDGVTATYNISPGQTLTANGDVRAINTAPIYKSGTGTLILGGDNDQLDNDIYVTAGTLDCRHQNCAGNSAGNDKIYADAGTTVRITLDAATDLNCGFQLNGTGVNLVSDRASSGAGVTHTFNTLVMNGAYTLNATAGANVASGTQGIGIRSTTTLAGNSVFDVADPGTPDLLMTLTGVVSGAYNLTKQGTATLTLAANNTYSGTTAVTAGTLVVQGQTATTSNAISSGAVLELNRSVDINYASNTAFTGTGTLRKTGSALVSWGASAATFSLGSGALIDIVAGAMYAGNSANEVWTSNLSDLTVAAGALFAGEEANIRVDAINGAGNIQSGYSGAGYSEFTFGVDNGSGDFTGVLLDAVSTGNYVKAGTGTQTLSGTNTYTGTTTVSAGVLKLNNTAALGTTAAGTTVASGAALDLNGLTYSSAEALTLSGHGISNSGALMNSSATGATFGGLITLGAAAGISAGTGNITLSNTGNTISGTTQTLSLWGAANGTIAGAIALGNAVLNKSGAGTWTLQGTSTRSGNSYDSAGALVVHQTNGMGTGDCFVNGANFTVLNNGAGNDGTITMAHRIILNSTFTSTLHVGNLTANTGNTVLFPYMNHGVATMNFTGANGYLIRFTNYRLLGGGGGTSVLNPTTTSLILDKLDGGNGLAHTAQLDGTSTGNRILLANDSSTALTVTKTNTSTWTMEGMNTYSGTTTISGGTLVVKSPGYLNSASAVTVASGATLAGTGSVNGSLTVASGGTLSPGISSAATLSSGATVLNSGTVLPFTLGTVNTDKLAVTGNLTLDGTVNVTAGTGFTYGTYTLATYTGTLTNNTLNLGTMPTGYYGTISAGGGVVTLSIADYTGFNYVSTIHFNTTASGAGVSGNVSDFPMLVRLDSNNFYFDQAQPDGDDIRFADPDGTALQYEIERWDATLKRAEIWVLVPQVEGNSDRDFMYMYWGSTTATAQTSATRVWQPANGFASVWHLGEDGNNNAGGYADATGNGNNGTGNSMTTASDVAGIIGKAQDFDGAADYISVGTGATLRPANYLTLSAWVKTRTGGHFESYYTNHQDNGCTESGFYPAYSTNSNKYWFSLRTASMACNNMWDNAPAMGTGGMNAWTHLTATYDGAKIRTYLNGAPNDSLATTGAIQWTSLPADSRIGMYYDDNESLYHDGTVDELSLANVARSADWIRLSYQSQKANTSTLVYPNSNLSNWAYNSKVYINTSATGADTKSDVSNFPLLVRLNGGNFNFSQARSDGADLRFADSSGNLLTYELERYDAANKLAEAWVLIPTVKGNNNTQFIRMYWGKPSATSLASASAVWRTDNSFAGVWHLNEDGNNSAGGYADATTVQGAGQGTNFTATSDTVGNVGRGLLFGGNNYITLGSNFTGVSGNGSRTVSAWVKTTSTTFRTAIFAQGTATNGNAFNLVHNYSSGNYYAGLMGYNYDFYPTQGRLLNDGTWHHVAAVYTSGAGLKIYVDGRLDAYDNGKTAYNTTGSNNFIGKSNHAGTDAYWEGFIDQVEYHSTPRSQDWVRLSYQTQKANNTTVRVGADAADYASSLRLTFNTTGTGANVSGNVANIPILVRLNSSNFAFASTRNDAADLQFVDKDGTYLYHEVVEWDKGNQTGKVWVRVPQVDGNSSTDFITLYYGCASCASSPYAVKDSVWNGYVAAWHLQGDEIIAEDVSPNNYHLTYGSSMPHGPGITSATTPYFTGSSADQNLNGTVPAELGGNTNWTLAFWMKYESQNPYRQWIMDFGSRANNTNHHFLLNTDGSTQFGLFGSTQNVFSLAAYLGTWVHCTVVMNGSTNTITSYVNGVQVDSDNPTAANINAAGGFRIGYYAGGEANYKGYLNEVAIAGSVRSADFIKLFYENQKTSSALFSNATLTTAHFQKSKVFPLNTTASGANVAGDVLNFPLLLRITGNAPGGTTAITDLTQSAGQDIRFLADDGVTWLDYQIERWNTTVDSAEVWVKVPRIKGNSTASYVTMYYQQAAGVTVTDGQCASCVFGAGNGYMGAWHLNTSGTGARPNAVAGGNSATPNNYNNDEFVGGYIAGADSLDGTDDFLHLGTGYADFSQGLSFSMWTNLASNADWSRLFDIGNGSSSDNILLARYGGTAHMHWEFYNGGSSLAVTREDNSITNNVWELWTGTFDPQTLAMNLYRNGSLIKTTTATGLIKQIARTNSYIGKSNWANAYLQGKVDEPQIANVVRDSNWVKLAYQSQRRDASPLFNPSPGDFQKTQKFTFNTTRTGANVMDSVVNFPLLVRITGNAPGTATPITDLVQGTGTNPPPDIRFLDGDGKTWLNYQVERWDRGVDSAEVWVMVPKVDGNSASDHITMYYQQATGVSIAANECASCVFSPSNGFAAVYHLNGEFSDHSGNGNTLTNNGTTAATNAVIGGAREFNGSTQYLTAANAASLNMTSQQTLSAWIFTDTFSPGNRRIIQKSTSGNDDQYILKDEADQIEYYNRSGGTYTRWTSLPSLATWHLLSATYDGSARRIYLNGAEMVSENSTGSMTTSTGPLDIGRKPGGGSANDYWDGVLDEVRIASTARSADWLKLEYETQRRTGNLFWGTRAGPNNLAVLTATAGNRNIALNWSSTVSDSANADSVRIWVGYTAYPDSAGDTLTTRVVTLPKTDSSYNYPAVAAGVYWFSLAIRNTSGAWSPITKASSDTANLTGYSYFPDTVYVDSALGSNSNSCTQAQNPWTPLKTITAATACETNGVTDTLFIRVMPGTYTDSVIDPNSKPQVITSFDRNSRAVFNGYTTSTDGSITNATLVIYNDVTLRNMDVKCAANDHVAIYLSNNEDNARVDGCRIYNNGNLKHRDGFNARQVGNNYISITNNLFHHVQHAGVYLTADNSFIITNNTFVGDGGVNTKGINHNVSNAHTDQTITNNIFYNVQYGIKTLSADGVISNNLFFMVPTGSEVGVTADANKIIKDPLFANTNPLDPNGFKLLPGSPAIDAGTTTFATGGEAPSYRYHTDFFGTRRPVGGIPDIGFYEGSGYSATPASEFDSLITTTTATTITVRNSKWKMTWDKARGAGINFFSDMSDSTTNLLASNTLLFDAKVGSYQASSQTSIGPQLSLIERTRARVIIRQWLNPSPTLDYMIHYTIYPSGHVYISAELDNIGSSAATLTSFDYTLKLATTTAAATSGGTKNGFGYLNTSTRDALLSVTQDLDQAAATAETWTATAASGSPGTIVYATANASNSAKWLKRVHSFLLYVGDASLDRAKAAALNADAYAPSVVTATSGSLLMERSWQDGLAGHWTMDDGGGGKARDKAVNNQNDATITAADTVWTSGKVGGALYLNTTDKAEAADNDALEACLGCTYMFWFKPDFAGMGTTAYVMSKGNGWDFRKVSGQNQITFTMGSGSATTPALTDGAWTHIAAVVKPSGTKIDLYVNGVMVANSTGAATANLNATVLRFGENAGGGAADRFKGTLDDIRIYRNEIYLNDIQAIYNRGFSPKLGHYALRADNNNRVVAVLNGNAAANRVQPAFQVTNWYGLKTPKFVYLNGTRLKPVTDFLVDTVNTVSWGSYLVLQLNRTLTGADQTVFIDDDDSAGYMGVTNAMKTLSITATANDKIVIKNFADTVFGSADSRQWYLELDLNGWTSPTSNAGSDSGFGEFNVWKSAAINPNVSVSGSTNLTGVDKVNGFNRSLTPMTLDLTHGSNTIFAGTKGYASPGNIPYYVTDSSATRISLALGNMSLSGDGTITLTKRWTVYPTGRIFASYVFSSISGGFNMDDPRVGINLRNSATPTSVWSSSTATSKAAWGLMGGDLNLHGLVGGIASIKNNNGAVTAAGSLISTPTVYSLESGSTDTYRTWMDLQPGLFNAGLGNVTLNFFLDFSRDIADSSSADSLQSDIRNPALITAITGARITNDALDFNADNFAEGDGAYTASAASGVAHFKFVNSVTCFYPAFRISSWTYGTLPEVVILDNQTLTKGYHYNAYLNAGANELVIQFNKTLAPASASFPHIFFISHKTGLAVTLNSFEAKDGDGVDTLLWTTESEFENLGYHVWRRVAPGSAQIDEGLAETDVVAGAGIANALAQTARSEAAKRAAAKMAQAAADSTLDTVPSMILSPEELRALGYERITPKIIPGAKGGSSASTQRYAWIDRSAAIGAAYEYLLEAVDFNGSKVQYGPRLARPLNPLTTELGSNYPNPFNPTTTLRFSLKEKLKVALMVYDAKGKLVRTLIRPDKPMAAGKYRLLWNAKDDAGMEVPSGQYFYRFTAGRYVKTRKMILVK